MTGDDDTSPAVGSSGFLHDAAEIVAALKTNPNIHDAAVVAFLDEDGRVGLYAFVEAQDVSSKEALALVAAHNVAVPDLLQPVEALPRDAAGAVRTEILQLIAMNQLDRMTPLIADAREFAVIARIVAGRKNLSA